MNTMARRSAVGLSLICALVFCALAAQSASAAEGKNTTAFECVKGGGEKDFSDAHCDNNVGAGKGEYGHVVLPLNEKVSLSISNEKTKNETKEAASTVLKGTIIGIKSEIVCKTVTGTGSLTNEEPSSKVHRVKGAVEAKFSSCTAVKPALGCKVSEPITVSSTVEGVEGLGTGKNEMGLEFKPTGEHFASVTLSGCLIAGTFNTDGTAVATGTPSNTAKWSGATSVFTAAMTKETLKLAGNPAEVESTTTVKRASNGNAVALTTVT